MVDSAPPVAPIAAAGSVSTGALTPVPVAVTAVPDGIQQLTRQIDVSGTLNTGSSANTFTLTTALGTLTVALPQLADAAKTQLTQQLLSLADSGKTITLSLQPGSPPSQGILLLPSTAGDSAATTMPLPATDSLLPTVAPPPAGAVPPALAAIVLPPATVIPGTVATTAGATLAAGTQQAVPAIGAGTVGQPDTASIAAPTLISPSAAAFASTSSLPPPGTEVTVRIAVTVPPGTALPPAGAGQIPATVIGTGPQGQTILRAGDALLYVRQPVDVPVGSNLLITVATAKDAGVELLKPAADTTLQQPLQAVMGALAQADPQLAAKLTQNLIPQPNPQLPGTLLFFMSALQQGDARGWLGLDAVSLLTKQGKAALIDQLASSFRAGGEVMQDGVVGQWQGYTIPFQAEGQMQMLNFYVHRDPQQSTGDNQTGRPTVTQTRFLIDVRMTRLGAVQLDGLTHMNKLDMIVRSETILPMSLPAELRAVYSDTLSAIGFSGSLNFQTGRANWLVMQQGKAQSVTT